jgi:hypothetical protein
MNAPSQSSSPEPEAYAENEDRRSSAPPGRWWFAFDRWMPVVEPEADEFVLA